MGIRCCVIAALGATALSTVAMAAPHPPSRHYQPAVTALIQACLDQGMPTSVCGIGTGTGNAQNDLNTAEWNWVRIPDKGGATHPSKMQDGVWIEIDDALAALSSNPTAAKGYTLAALADANSTGPDGGPPPFPKPRLAKLVKEILAFGKQNPKEAKQIVTILEKLLK